MAHPSSVSTVCRSCHTRIDPAELKDAVQTRTERDDGGYSLQYDHPDGECPIQRENRINDAHPSTTILGAKR